MRFVLGLVKPGKIILGTDFAAEEISLGKNVKSVKVADKVFGFTDTGSESQAEYITVTEDDVFLMPEEVNFKQAAASLEGLHNSYTLSLWNNEYLLGVFSSNSILFIY